MNSMESKCLNLPKGPHVLIIGAGITGLTLAQALKSHHIPFTVFERDSAPSTRGRGWSLTIHWALDIFLSLLPPHIIARLPECNVDPVAVEEGETGHFLFFDLRSGKPRWQTPAAKRIRVRRERLRALLMDGIDIKWCHALENITHLDPNTVTVHFSNAASATGTLLVGADGSRSTVRSHLFSREPCLARNLPLPVRFLGANVIYPPSLALKARTLDPFFFQAGDPQADTFLWFSFLNTPSKLDRHNGQGVWECQVNISYPYRTGFWGREEPLEVPATNEERVALLKGFAEGWAEPFRSLIMEIPDETQFKSLPIEDFVPREGMWDNAHGTVTMVGDAAHAMTIYRGEAANHGISDVSVLLSHILLPLKGSSRVSGSGFTALDRETAISAYEHEMIARTGPAVLSSRRACLDAHDYQKINDKSPLVTRRAVVEECV